jgi:hypothetical protein
VLKNSKVVASLALANNQEDRMAQINVQNTKITVLDIDNKDYICLTDMAGAKENDVRAADVIKNWLRNRYTLEFLGTWETIHNPGFKVVEFDHFRKEAGLPTFVLSCSEWIEKTNQLSHTYRRYQAESNSSKAHCTAEIFRVC